jgi:hypothetical protein
LGCRFVNYLRKHTLNYYSTGYDPYTPKELANMYKYNIKIIMAIFSPKGMSNSCTEYKLKMDGKET